MNTLAKAVLATLVGGSSIVVAQNMGQTEQQQQQQNRQGTAQNSQANSQERQQATRQITVRESVIYGLGDEPREKLHKAALKLAEEPFEAAKCVKVAANHLELIAAAADSGGEDLRRAARQLEQVADRIRNHELTDMKQAKREFGRALFALADSQQKAAQAGLTKGNEKQLGYTLKGAAENLAAAATFSDVQSDKQLARAIFNAEAAGKQIVALNYPTTYQNNGQMLQTTEEGTSNAQPAGIFDSAQTATERQSPDNQQRNPGVQIDRNGVRINPGSDGQQNNNNGNNNAQPGASTDRFSSIADAARQSVQDLGTAITQLRGQMQQSLPQQ